MIRIIDKFVKFWSNKNIFKIKLLVFSIILFSILYSFLGDSNFKGLNLIEDELENKLAKEQLNLDLKRIYKEKFKNLINTLQEEDQEENIEDEDYHKKRIKSVQDIINNIKNKKITQSIYIRYYNRLYFTVVTACLLGYGDIHPNTIICKFFAMLQALITVFIIVF